jgi:hypothetical protein
MFRSAKSWCRRFSRKDEGATAVEFALVVVPFIGMTMAILELGIYFLASRFMEDAVFRAGRQVMTEQIGGTNCTQLETEVRNQLPTLIRRNDVTVSVGTGGSVGSAGTPVATGAGGCSLGPSGSIVILTASYNYPFTGFRFFLSGGQIGKNMPITASTAFRKES